MSNREDFQTLANSFRLPKPGLNPWDPDLLAENYPAASTSEQHVIAFLISVWSGGSYHPWDDVPKFDVIAAFHTWDDKNREAFLAWAERPFFP